MLANKQFYIASMLYKYRHDVAHMILTPRLFRFSACNIENWEEPRDEAIPTPPDSL